MAVSFNKCVRVLDHVLFRELEGESVLLNIKNENYLGLDDVGTRMWNVLTTSTSIQEAFETLQQEYAVETDRLSSDLSGFIEKLVEHDLVGIVDV